MILMMFIGTESKLFRRDFFHTDDLPIVVKEMHDILDNVVCKAPMFNENRVLYRFLKSPDDEKEWNIGDIYKPDHSLTTTATEDWEQETNSFEITVNLDNTKAHCLYLLLPPNSPQRNTEKQVNFERGTSFQIYNITQQGEYKRYYLKEL